MGESLDISFIVGVEELRHLSVHLDYVLGFASILACVVRRELRKKKGGKGWWWRLCVWVLGLRGRGGLWGRE